MSWITRRIGVVALLVVTPLFDPGCITTPDRAFYDDTDSGLGVGASSGDAGNSAVGGGAGDAGSTGAGAAPGGSSGTSGTAGVGGVGGGGVAGIGGGGVGGGGSGGVVGVGGFDGSVGGTVGGGGVAGTAGVGGSTGGRDAAPTDAGTWSCGDGVFNGDETDFDCGGACTPCDVGSGCVIDADCAIDSCVFGLCRVPSCVDLVQSGTETDVNCGGGSCPRCAPSQSCANGDDCQSFICAVGSCTAPLCTDGVQNGAESDVDCGGSACQKCAVAAGCFAGSDCRSGICTGGVCQPASCTDGVANGTETDVDCGGPSCPRCGTGAGCQDPSDCVTSYCVGQVCNDPSCADGILGGNETDVDCGGVDCGPCSVGKGCGVDEDCTTFVCNATCRAPRCNDGVLNGIETDVDCGATCTACPDGATCIVPADCDSGICTGGSCVTATCADGVSNGTETGIDCGGSTCPNCALLESCVLDTDCASGFCSAGVCAVAACGNGFKDGFETDTDCGGSECATCPVAADCLVHGDCSSGVCTGNVCQLPTCSDGVANGAETDADCGGGACAKCTAGSGCVMPGDCVSGVCASLECRAGTCSDGVKNGTETDVDCGGSCATGCGTGFVCSGAADCTSGICAGGACQAPACGDGVKNGTETDLDCGGLCPADCATGSNCLSGSDCQTGFCSSGGICQAPGCSDGVQSGTETGVDCGGGGCPGCPAGETCVGSGDCTSSVCNGGTCQAPACTDGVANGTESDTDCGGGGCPTCPSSSSCALASDCTSKVCTGGTCQAALCDDGIKNGSESAVDCGGATCPKCTAGQPCGSGSDCTSNVCTGGVCQSAACGDGVKNGTETDVDCGGACAADCLPGQSCASGGDCTSKSCSGGVCQTASCSDVIKNGTETDIDCGGTCAADCAVGKACSVNGDCVLPGSGKCTGGICQGAACGDGVKNGTETDIDCGGTCAADCAVGKACSVNGDCVLPGSGKCTGGVCQAATCGDGAKNGTETDIDCGGTCPVDCVAGQACGSGADCVSKNCVAGLCQAAGCGDGVKNGSETDIDCGGTCPADCGIGQACGVNTDCALPGSGKCTGGVCQVAGCSDAVKNSDETDVDCGGSCAADCADGKSCAVDGDCVSGSCSGSGLCQSASCGDTILNGDETDVDCGGSCPGCPSGGACTTGPDCLSQVCTGSVCAAPQCNDTILNGDETDIDCGGSCSQDCLPDQGCGTGADCTSLVCVANVCQAPTCGDNVQNGDETDADCGGSCSLDCGVGQGCGVNSDCVLPDSGKCTGEVCQAAACNDGIENGAETDVDCGGSCVNSCAVGKGCSLDADCALPASGKCVAGVCQAAACGDGIQNGTETDVDCGGTCAADCAVGKGCSANGDCALPTSGKCTGGVCQAAACGDGVKNGSETDLDCGGGCAADCGVGQSCAVNGDCALPGSGRCSGGVCVAATCPDGVKNGSETDVDCGGSCSTDCFVGQSCSVNGDCALPSSGRCAAGLCVAASCPDGVKNGDETDLDCGGSCAADCAVGQSCSTNADCVLPGSGKCSGGQCVAGSCPDGVKNGDETDLDCGGSCSTDCGVGQSCGVDGDCALPSSGKCTAGACAAGSCPDGVKNGTETDLDCGGSCATDCAIGQSCSVNADCALPGSGKCSGNLCIGASCPDGVKNGTETDLDCGGSCATDCAIGQSCSADADCALPASGKCTAGACAAAGCSDGVKNGSETDLDCGGSCVADCVPGQACNVAGDCTSGQCVAGQCADPSGCVSGTATETFSDGMVGCAGTAAFPERGDLCSSQCSVCTAAQWVASRGGAVPAYNYWTNDNLRYTGGGPNSCAVTLDIAGSDCGVDQPMRVCSATGSDPLGNLCNWYGCGDETNVPNEYFGGCSGNFTAGTLCCCGFCTDGVLNGDETDVDCGGNCTVDCGVGQGCSVNADCALPESGVCSGGACAAASCTDGVLNGTETDVDCGGSCPGDCNVGQICVTNADCALPASGRCSGGVCVAATCPDGVKNGTETDLDCGGSCVIDCPVGGVCGGNGDCVLPDSGKCTGGFCAAASCPDGVKNGNETGLDCGGSCATDCGIGVGCQVDADCALPASGKCQNKVCVAASCPDGVKNGSETDLDCGGSCSIDCQIGDDCLANNDCVLPGSGRCSGNLCVAASCPDGVQNGSETDLDCGGSCVIDCQVGDKCLSDGDCGLPDSGKCSGGTCALASCPDGVQNGGETSLDCGGANCGIACPIGSQCLQNSDCEWPNSGVCIFGSCGIASCSDGVWNGDETDVDCGGSCLGCGVGQACGFDEDCALPDSGVCKAGACQPPACDDLVQNGAESDVDCGGACPLCQVGQGCFDGADCNSQACDAGLCTGCASSSQQIFDNDMSGCPETITFGVKDSLCAPGCHTCSAAEWIANRNGQIPGHHYWTSNNLLYNGVDQNCSVSTSVGYDCGASTPMRVCTPSPLPPHTDPLGNVCNWVECGYETNQPIEHFGGCGGNTTAGTLCCCNQDACVPSGAEQCTNGQDDDCDDLVDCPVLTSRWPEEGKATSGADATFTFQAPFLPSYQLQCRTARPDLIGGVAWAACGSGPGNLTAKPFTAIQSQNALNDGLKVTEVRFYFPGISKYSSSLTFRYYVHHTMHAAAKCARVHSDDEWFAAAATWLQRAPSPVFAAGEARVDNPFIKVSFSPPVDSTFSVGINSGLIQVRSLRHRFVVSSDQTMLLINRAYVSTHTGSCNALRVPVHQPGSVNVVHKNTCHAAVINKNGAGVCLRDNAGVIQRVFVSGNPYGFYAYPPYFSGANQFMWRKLTRGDRSETSFFPKCTTAGCGNADQHYLPDMAFFP